MTPTLAPMALIAPTVCTSNPEPQTLSCYPHSRSKSYKTAFPMSPAPARSEGLGFRVQGSGCRVQGSGSKVEVSGFRVQGSGFKPRQQACGPKPQPGATTLNPLLLKALLKPAAEGIPSLARLQGLPLGRITFDCAKRARSTWASAPHAGFWGLCLGFMLFAFSKRVRPSLNTKRPPPLLGIGSYGRAFPRSLGLLWGGGRFRCLSRPDCRERL